MRWSTASRRSVAKKRSAIMPTKKGEIIAANAVVPYAKPTSSPEKWSVAESQVPIVTDQAPQTKYWRNIIAESLSRTDETILSERLPHVCHALLDFFDRSSCPSMFVLDESADRIFLFLQQRQHCFDRCVAFAPRNVWALILFAI